MTTASPTSLTDRYIAETLQSIPSAQRADIEAELRTLVADAIEDRLEAGIAAADAEREVLTDLGAPRRLAASYSQRTLQLIGPELYLDYVRVLTALLSTVVPLWLLVRGLATFAGGASVPTAFGAALSGAAETAVVVAFVTTLVFALIERSPAMRSRRKAVWNPTALPELRSQRGYFGELIGGVIFVVVFAAILVLLQTVGAVDGAGPIAPDLWESGVFSLVLLFAIVSISFHMIAYYTGWSLANAVATTALGVIFVVPTIWIITSGRLLNDDYFAAIGWPQGVGIISTITACLVILFALMDSVNSFVRASTSKRTR